MGSAAVGWLDGLSSFSSQLETMGSHLSRYGLLDRATEGALEGDGTVRIGQARLEAPSV